MGVAQVHVNKLSILSSNTAVVHFFNPVSILFEVYNFMHLRRCLYNLILQARSLLSVSCAVLCIVWLQWLTFYYMYCAGLGERLSFYLHTLGCLELHKLSTTTNIFQVDFRVAHKKTRLIINNYQTCYSSNEFWSVIWLFLVS